MNAPLSVEDGVLVRVVFGARPDEFDDQGGLAAQAPPRNDDRPALPADDARVDEDTARRALGHVELQVWLQSLEAVSLDVLGMRQLPGARRRIQAAAEACAVAPGASRRRPTGTAGGSRQGPARG